MIDHLMPSLMSRVCTACGLEKEASSFSKNSSSPDGLYSRCRECAKVAKAAYRARPEVIVREAERLRQDYLRNKEARLAKRKARYQAKREETLAHNKRWREANLEKHRALCRQWAKEHPGEMRAIVARRRARIAEAEGTHTAADVRRLWDEQDGFCLGCRGDLFLLGYHVDHIYPLSKGGANSPENLQLLCPTCNRQKGDKLPEEWRPDGL